MIAYKFSCYNLLFEYSDTKYIYNTLSTAIAEIDESTAYAINNNEITSIDGKYYKAMKSQHFIVDSRINEIEEYLYFYDRTRFGRSSKSLSINFIPSYNCNLACPYCLQGQNKENKSISLKDIDKILRFVESTIADSSKNDVPIQKLFIHFYGGEPMMQKESLFTFIKPVNEIVSKNNCHVYYSMTSNLTLLDDDMINLMKEYNICTQVSIDGTKYQHDLRRIYKNGSGTYDIILNNLRRLNKKGLKDCITIRLNIDRDNLKDAEEIMKSVRSYSDDVYFGFLDTFKGFNDSFLDCISNEVYPEIVSRKFNEIYKKYDCVIPQPFGKMSPCSLCSENKFFIDSSLNVYKCEMLLNQSVASVGYINDNGEFVPNAGFYHQMNHSPKMFTECQKCKLLPLCAGGCAGKAYISSNRNDGILNEKYCMFTEESLIAYLKTYIEKMK
jgi:uncharacterized protein